MPLLIKKIAAQNNYIVSKNTFEIGNSSKQTEFSDNMDDYLMHIENNPNVINQAEVETVAKSELFNDTDHGGNTSNEEVSNDPPWNGSPKQAKRKKYKKHKVETNEAKVNITKKAMNLIEQKRNQDVENNCDQHVEDNYSKDESDVLKENTNKMRNDHESEDSSVYQLLEKQEELDGKKCDKSSDVDNQSNKESSSHSKDNGGVKMNGFKPKSKISLEEELFGNKIENPNKVIPFVTKTYSNTSRHLSFNEKSNASIFDFDGAVDIVCPKGTTYSDYKQYGVLKNNAQCKKTEKEPPVKEREKDTQDEIFEALFQDKKGGAKRKALLLEKNPSSKKKNKGEDNETSKPFNDVNNVEQNTKRTRKQLGYNKNTNEIEKLICSKKLKIDNTFEKEATSDVKEPKKFKIENKVKNGIETQTTDIHTKESEEELNQKEISSPSRKEKEDAFISKITRKRKNSKDDEGEEVTKVGGITKTVQKTMRRKVNSESSTDLEISKGKEVSKENNETRQTKRTRATTRGVAKRTSIDESSLEDENANQTNSTNKSETTRGTNKKSNFYEITSEHKTKETAFEDNSDKSTPKRILNKRVLKKTALQDEDHPKLDSVSSGSTGEYFTPSDDTPALKNNNSVNNKELSTPQPSRVSSRDKGTPKTSQSDGLKLPEKLNMTNTPSLKNPSASTVKKNPTTPASNVKKNPTIPASNVKKNPTTPASNVKKNPTTPASNVKKNPTTPASNVKKNPTTPVSSVKKNPALNAMYKRNMKGETPLHTACKKDATKVLTLLKNNMTPNVKDNAGWTPLHDAVSIGNESVVRLLLESGALVNVPGMDNDTPLHLAARNERPALGRLLIQYGADVELRNLEGYKPLEYFDVIGRPDLKAQILAARTLPSLATAPAPPPPSCIDCVLYGDGLDKGGMSVLGRFAKTMTSGDQPIIVSTLLQSNVTMVIVRGTPDRLCTPTPNVLRAILSGIKAVDFSWVEKCLEESRVKDTKEYEIVGTVNYPQARPFVKSRQNNDKMFPGLFNGLQAYLSKPWSPRALLTQDDLRHFLKLGGASLLNREPDPESTNQNESTVMYHVTNPAHRLYRLSQAILYPEEAAPRRLYNMEHVKALGLAWFVACIEQFEIVEPKSLYDE
ncbi:hypothetical protein WDU94_003259 [Cyamophila willieti]